MANSRSNHNSHSNFTKQINNIADMSMVASTTLNSISDEIKLIEKTLSIESIPETPYKTPIGEFSWKRFKKEKRFRLLFKENGKEERPLIECSSEIRLKAYPKLPLFLSLLHRRLTAFADSILLPGQSPHPFYTFKNLPIALEYKNKILSSFNKPGDRPPILTLCSSQSLVLNHISNALVIECNDRKLMPRILGAKDLNFRSWQPSSDLLIFSDLADLYNQDKIQDNFLDPLNKYIANRTPIVVLSTLPEPAWEGMLIDGIRTRLLWGETIHLN